MSNSGENDQAMRKILDMTRLISIVILALHFYVVCYGAFAAWHLVSSFTDRILDNIIRTGLFKSFHRPKFISLIFLLIALFGVQGKKDEKQNFKTVIIYLMTGLFFFFIGYFVLLIHAGVVILGHAVYGNYQPLVSC